MTKNTSYHYSIIIPHKNTPRLLERCLYSIPTWDEIQIIIIDDNSNSESVDFSNGIAVFVLGVVFGEVRRLREIGRRL
ncbi:glycosyltransferase, partial [Phocaeicola vulgatus]|uniref:glycosyltransferase n=1 Tax=Phocaeicola vulgatus TaxID=821 RepID=UPI0039B67F98